MTTLRRQMVGVVGAVGFLLAMPTPIESARWWRSPRFVKQLSLTPSQQSAIEHIYQETIRDRLARARDARAAHERLSRLLESDASNELLEAAASQAAEADAARSRRRTLMLYRMSRVLSAAQRARFAALASTRSRALRNGAP